MHLSLQSLVISSLFIFKGQHVVHTVELLIDRVQFVPVSDKTVIIRSCVLSLHSGKLYETSSVSHNAELGPGQHEKRLKFSK